MLRFRGSRKKAAPVGTGRKIKRAAGDKADARGSSFFFGADDGDAEVEVEAPELSRGGKHTNNNNNNKRRQKQKEGTEEERAAAAAAAAAEGAAAVAAELHAVTAVGPDPAIPIPAQLKPSHPQPFQGGIHDLLS
jgi:hypothetical protein